MHKAMRLVPFMLAGVLAACGGGNVSQNTLPTQTPTSVVQQPLSNTVVTPEGTYTQMFTREVQAQVAAVRTALRHGGGGGSTNLTLHGGPVSVNPSVHLILWGSAWGGANGGGPGDPHGAAAYLQSFYSHMGGTSWHNIDTQYYGSNGTHITNTTVFTGTTYDSSNPPSSPSQSQIAAEAAKIAGTNGGPNNSYVVALPSGISPSGFKTQYCAYHSSTSANGTVISYTNLPYQSDAGTSCGVGSVTSPGYNDGFSIVGGHEQVETETDPQPNTGWLDGSGSENGDKCAWTNLQNTNLNGVSFPTQPIWDNAITGCAQSGP